MKKFSKRIIIALCVLFSIAAIALYGCSQDNQSAIPPSHEQVDTDEENKDEQDNSEENPANESKPSLPGGLVDGGGFPSDVT